MGFVFFLLLLSWINVLPNVLQMLIYILTLTRKRIPLRIKSSDTIADVKEKILDNEGIPMHMQRLIFAGKELDNSLTLANYHIQEKSTLKFVLRIMGD